MLLAHERGAHGVLDARATEALRGVADDVGRERSLRVDALVGAVGLRDGFGEHDVVGGDDGAALLLGDALERVVVAAAVLQVVRLHDLHVGEVGDKGGKEQREDGDEPGEALAQGGAAQDARLARRLDRRGARHLGLQAGSLVAGAEQQADDDEAREQRGAALAHEGERQAGERDEARDAADDDEGLQADGRGKADGREGGHVGLGTRRREKAADGEEHEQEYDARRAEQAHLLGDGREDEVTLHLGNESGHAATDATTKEPAVCQRV